MIWTQEESERTVFCSSGAVLRSPVASRSHVIFDRRQSNSFCSRQSCSPVTNCPAFGVILPCFKRNRGCPLVTSLDQAPSALAEARGLPRNSRIGPSFAALSSLLRRRHGMCRKPPLPCTVKPVLLVLEQSASNPVVGTGGHTT